jgi:hypothetical protein
MRLTTLAFGISAFAACLFGCASSNNPSNNGGSGGDQTGEGGTDEPSSEGTGGDVGTGGSTKKGTGGSGTGGKSTSVTGSGGAPGTGGKGTGGAGTGGTTATTPTGVDCTDTSAFTSLQMGPFVGTPIPVTGSTKQYRFISNWWGAGQSNAKEQITGLGFTIMGNSTSTNDSPMGFPSIFIGNYNGASTPGSGLPKQVSALTSIPTIFSTNVATKGTSQYNATYDVWFTAGSGGPTNDPGPGGAFLMVWQFKTSDRYPRGKLKLDGQIIPGVKGAWSIWVDSTNPPCVSYVSSAMQADLSFDLVNFIQHAVKNGYGVTNNQYLNVIFAGFEVWGGGDGLQVKKYCANVK